MKFTERDRVCIPVPLYHCFGMVVGNLGCLTHGATMVFPCEGFDPSTVCRRCLSPKWTTPILLNSTAFPMTVTGKIQKFVMREQMIAELRLTMEKTA